MGYWNPENVGGPVIIPSNVITMEGVDQPLIGISDTGDVQYMEPGEDYEFDGEYVTEYPVAQKGKRVPITVSDPRDPRLKRYQDSLRLHNLSMEAVNPKYYNRNPSDPLGVTTPSSGWFKDKENNAAVNAFIKKYGLLGSRDPLPKGIQPIDYIGRRAG